MKKITRNKYYESLKKVYFDERMQKSKSAYYITWINNKFAHSIDVTKVGIEIILTTPLLSMLPAKVKTDFISALLLHDLARAKEIDYKTGKKTGIDHGTLGARDAVALGESSLYVIIPILLHSRFDEAFINAETDLSQHKEFCQLSKEDQEFVQVYRNKFLALDDYEQKLILLGVYLVKDADKLSNLMHVAKMVPMEPYEHKPWLSQVAKDDVFKHKFGMIRRQSVFTICDCIAFWMTWVNDLRFRASRQILDDNKTLQEIKNLTLEMFGSTPKQALQKLEDDFDQLILLLEQHNNFID